MSPLLIKKIRDTESLTLVPCVWYVRLRKHTAPSYRVTSGD